jgi:hypothetical protein
MWTPLRIQKEFRTREEWDTFVESVARAALVAYFKPNGAPVTTGAGGHPGTGHRAMWSAFEDMKQDGTRRNTVREVERALRGEADDEAESFEPRPGWWQPEVQIGGEWLREIPPGYSVPFLREGRPFAISHDDGKLKPFKVFYVDEEFAGMGQLYTAHGVWSLDFFNPNGVVVNDGDRGECLGGQYILRFKKIPEPVAPSKP